MSFHNRIHSLTMLVCGWMLGWRWGWKSVVLAGTVLWVEEGSNLTAAVAGTLWSLVLRDTVGLSVSAFFAAEAEAGSLDVAALSGLSRRTTLR